MSRSAWSRVMARHRFVLRFRAPRPRFLTIRRRMVYICMSTMISAHEIEQNGHPACDSDHAAIRCSRTGPARFGVPPFGRIAPEHFKPAFAQAFAAHAGEVAAIAADRRSRPSPTPSRRSKRAARRSRARPMFSIFWPARTPTMPFWRSSAIWRRSTPGTGTGSCMNEALFRRIERSARRSATASASLPSRRACSSATTRCSGAPARRSTPRQEQRLADDQRAAGERSAPRSARTCWPTSRSYTLVARRRGRSRRPARFRARGGARRGRRARPAGQARHHALALQRRAVPAILRPPRSAREGLPRLDRARRRRRRDRQQGDHRRDGGAARRAGAAARLRRPSRITGSTTRWRRRRRRCAACSNASGRRRARARWPTATPCRRWSQAEGGNFTLAPWDWRYYAEKLRKRALRRRRGGDQAVLPARPHDRGGVLHRATGCSA